MPSSCFPPLPPSSFQRIRQSLLLLRIVVATINNNVNNLRDIQQKERQCYLWQAFLHQ
jgi:hypothetical protein